MSLFCLYIAIRLKSFVLKTESHITVLEEDLTCKWVNCERSGNEGIFSSLGGFGGVGGFGGLSPSSKKLWDSRRNERERERD